VTEDIQERSTCCATFCRHGIEGCPNLGVVEITVSARRGERQEGSARRPRIPVLLGTLIALNTPVQFGVCESLTRAASYPSRHTSPASRL
jgi:hypothetical protein